MSDQTVDAGQEAVDRIADAGGIDGIIPANEPTSGADTGAESPAEEAERLYAGKYKTPDDLERAYTEAQRKMHEESQARAQLEQQLQEYQQPAEPSPFGMLGPQADDLFAMAADNPAMAYYNSIVHAGQLGWQAEKIQEQLYAYWFSVNPRAAQQYEWQRWQAENAPAEPDAPDLATNYAMQQVYTAAGQRALADYPWLQQYSDQILQRLSPEQLGKAMETPDPVQSLYDLVIDAAAGIHLRATKNQPPAEQAAPATPGRVATQRRNGAPPASNDPAEAWKQRILSVPDKGIDFTKLS